MNSSAATSVIAYGRSLMQEATQVDCASTVPPSAWQAWTSGRLFDRSREAHFAVESIWTLVKFGSHLPRPHYVPIHQLDLTTDAQKVWALIPSEQEASFALAAASLGQSFVQHGGAREQNFDRFYFLMQKYASSVPCTYGEDGVSLFQQWRMVAAVMALSADGTPDTLPADLALIGLDFPGIQETVYTIASRGAGKSVRGRSAFVQLLVNAVVDRIVRELDLCRANVIVNAGGNALILAGWSDELEHRLRTLDHDINHLLLRGDDDTLFTGFQGDLSLALAWTKVDWRTLKYPCETEQVDGQSVSRWQWYEKRLKDQLQQAKQRPFGALLVEDQGFEQLFGRESIHSNRYCAVCRRPENDRTGEFRPLDDEEPEILGASQIVCPLCKSFRKLADRLGKREAAGFLNRSTQRPTNPDIWQIGLHAASDYWYSLDDQGDATALALALSPDDFPAPNVDGFWPLATTTPRMNESDVEKAEKWEYATAKVGDIRDNQQLADDSPGTFKRLGVLKADVDDLGTLLVNGLGTRRSAALTATFSESLTLFFGGWLDKICAEEPFFNKVYVLYAGGDDLLIIGTWDVIPLLAQRIAEDFRRYTGENPGVHLSAGISIIGGKEPLYAGVEAANKVLEQAKRYPSKQQREKNAINFIGKVFAWEDFNDVVNWQRELAALINRGAPKALLMTLLQIYMQYQDDLPGNTNRVSGYTTHGTFGSYHGNSLYLGPWLWQMVYRLHRLSNPTLTPEKVQEIQRALLQTQREGRPGGVDKMALSARWVQLVSRKKEEE